VDYLREAAEFHAALPVRASVDIECEIASALRKIAAWEITEIGASACEGGSRLFGMTENPLQNRSFIHLLQYFRIDRLEKYVAPTDSLPV
jgi:sugar fermentation stimulation protein A